MLTHAPRQLPAWLIFNVGQNHRMKWLYLALAIFATAMTVVVAASTSGKERVEGLRVCVTAAAVNFGLFYALRWAQRKNSPGKERKPWTIRV